MARRQMDTIAACRDGFDSFSTPYLCACILTHPSPVILASGATNGTTVLFKPRGLNYCFFFLVCLATT